MQPKLCIPGQLNQNRGHGASITIVCYGLRTSVGSQRRFDDIAPAHRHTPKCAIGCRSRTGLIVHSSRSTSFGRSPRLVSRSGRPSRAAEGAKAVGERAALSHCTARRRRPFPAQKAGMLGSGGCSGRMPIFLHSNFDGAACERPQLGPLRPPTPASQWSSCGPNASLELDNQARRPRATTLFAACS